MNKTSQATDGTPQEGQAVIGRHEPGRCIVGELVGADPYARVAVDRAHPGRDQIGVFRVGRAGVATAVRAPPGSTSSVLR